MEEKVRLTYLIDFYGELLNENQLAVLDDYAESDFSISEIAKERDISRQAVYDMIRRCGAKLEEYERKLGLLERFMRIRKHALDIKEVINSWKSVESGVFIDEIEELANSIIESL